MFNRFKLFIFAIVALCFCGCTLMMDDFDIPEEEKGKDEPYTEVLPIGNVTYKYDEKTTPLNGRAQDYIAMYNDSVVYLMDNIPSEWIPKVGGYVAANTTRKTPLGISGRVTSVTRENGLIRVDHVPATRDEVFDVFKAEFDFSFTMPPLEEYDSLEYAENGLMLNDSTYVDMNFFERITGDTVTRADKESSKTLSFNISHQFNEFYGKLEPLNGTYIELEYKSTEHKTIHYYENKDEGKREEWNDSYSEQTFRGVFGYGTDAKSVREHYKKKAASPLGLKDLDKLLNVGNTPEELMNSDVWKKNIQKKIKQKFRKKVFVLPTGTAVFFTLDFDVDAYFQAMGYLDVSYTITTPKVRAGYKIVDGVKKPVDDILTKENRKLDIDLRGNFDFYGRVRGGVGVGLGSLWLGGAVIVGVEAKVGVRGEFDIESEEHNTRIDESGGEEVYYVDDGNCRIVPYVSLGGYAKGEILVLGIPFELGDLNFMTQTKEWPVSLENVLDNHTAKYLYVKNELTGKKFLVINSKYSFGQIDDQKTAGVYSNISDRVPGIIVYAGDYSGQFYAIFSYDEPVKPHKEYEINLYTETHPLPEANEYKIVPCIYDKKQNFVVEYRNKARTLGNAKPAIAQPVFTPWYAEEMNEYAFEDFKKKYPYLKYYKHSDFADYCFVVDVKLSNTMKLKKWGVYYLVYSGSGKKLIDKKVYVNNGEERISAGKYSVITQFFSNYKPTEFNEYFSISIRAFGEYEEDGEVETVWSKKIGPYALTYPLTNDEFTPPTKNVEYVDLH